MEAVEFGGWSRYQIWGEEGKPVLAVADPSLAGAEVGELVELEAMWLALDPVYACTFSEFY